MKRIRDMREHTEWLHRRGRFAGLDRDEDDRIQVMPVAEIPEREQTHNTGARRREGGEDDA